MRETKFLEHSPQSRCPLYVLYKFPLTQVNFLPVQVKMHSHWRADEHQFPSLNRFEVTMDTILNVPILQPGHSTSQYFILVSSSEPLKGCHLYLKVCCWLVKFILSLQMVKPGVSCLTDTRGKDLLTWKPWSHLDFLDKPGHNKDPWTILDIRRTLGHGWSYVEPLDTPGHTWNSWTHLVTPRTHEHTWSYLEPSDTTDNT